MKPIKLITVSILPLLLNACAHLEKEKEALRKVRIGMHETEVRAVMGKPDDEILSCHEKELQWIDAAVVLNKDMVVTKASLEETPKFNIYVESFKGISPIKKKAIILPANKGMSRNDLEFQQTRNVIVKILKENSYSIADESSEAEADVVVFVQFGVSDPQKETKIISHPVYNYTPPSTVNTTSTISNSLGQNLGQIQSSTSYAGDYAYKGQSVNSITTTKYLHHLILEAVDYQTFKENKELKYSWKVKTNLTTVTNDLSRVVPYLAVIAGLYVGTATYGINRCQIYLSDSRVR